MPRVKPTTKLGVFGEYDLSPEKAVMKIFETNYIKLPNFDVARLSFEIKGIQSNQECEEVTRDQHRMRTHCHVQFEVNERRFNESDRLLYILWKDFLAANKFLKVCKTKENESHDTIINEEQNQLYLNEEINHIQLDIDVLQDFVAKYIQKINNYSSFEIVLTNTMNIVRRYGTIDDLMKRCDSLLLAQVDILEKEKRKTQEIDKLRESLMECLKTASYIITGLNNNLSGLQERLTRYWGENVKWERAITIAKNYMEMNEMKSNCIQDSIHHLFNLIQNRHGQIPKFLRTDVEKRMDFIKEEACTMQEIKKKAYRKLVNEYPSLIAERGSD
ncbi:uncharacterized protein LOC131432551 [Malaya genurostris]|uniref:uncharacterized protein LOC131432551 n=1 Tax=Malaya genurostris TaxID=325434 RepID=UPI0026F3FD56|nr:uncharacterized protein LOC131432551 [Malaya genurostris]